MSVVVICSAYLAIRSEPVNNPSSLRRDRARPSTSGCAIRDVARRVPESSPRLAPMIDGSDGTPEIRLTDLTKHFRDVRAVDRISMDIRSGEFFSMLGPSGCGKTTTLRMIGGFELPTAGRIELRGRDVTTDPPDKRPVNMVFQNYALFPHLDVHENIAFGLRRKGVERADTRRRVGEALDLVHLGGYDKRKPNQLSGGQQQRVALARALVNRPNVLLLDEPLGALDLKLRKALQVELKRVQVEVGITFVYVTHDQEEALTMSDRIAVMRAGKVEQLGTPEELYERPRTRFVADFIGTSNLLTGAIESIANGCAVVRLSSGEACLTSAGSDVAVGRPVELSVRPEAIVLHARTGNDPSQAAGSIPAAVEQVAYLGGNVQYLVRSEGGLSITALAPKTGQRLPVGGVIDVTWSPGDALVLAEHPAAQEETPA
jgi:spermidine/putrescine transport system ATP-binding protein